MEKKYFSIKEVTKMLDLPASTLRFWEKEIDAFNPNKSAGGTRRYVQKDIDVLKHCMSENISILLFQSLVCLNTML